MSRERVGVREQLADFINTHQERVRPFGDALGLVRTQGDLLPGAVTLANGKHGDLRAVLSDRDAFSRIRTYSQSEIAIDPLMKRQAQRLYRLYLAHQVEPNLEAATTALEEQLRAELLSFRCDLGNGPLGWHAAWAVFHGSADARVRREAWTKLMDLAAHLSPMLLDLVAVRNRAAREQGFTDHFELATTIRELDDVHLEDLFRGAAEHTHGCLVAAKEDLDKDIAAFFHTRRNFMRPWHYADPMQLLPPWDLESDRPPRREAVTAAQAFLRRRGLSLPSEAIRPAKVSGRDATRDPWALLIDIGRLMHGVAEQLFRANADPELPEELRCSPHPIMTWAVWYLLVDEIAGPDVLEESLGFEPKEAAKARGRFEERHRRQVLITAQQGLAFFTFERELYRNPGQDLTALWWELIANTLHLDGRDEVSLPAWAVSPAVLGSPTASLDRALGAFVAAQIRETLPPADPGSTVLRSKDASKALKSLVLHHAGGRSWQEHVRRATGMHLNARDFVETMAPTSL